MPYGLIPHRLPKDSQRGEEELESEEQSTSKKEQQATDQQSIIGFIDDGASPSSRSISSSSSSSDRDESSSRASTSSLERDLTEIEPNGAAEVASVGGDGEGRSTAAVDVDVHDAPSSSSTSTSPPSPTPPRPSWPPPRKPKKQYAQLQMPSPEQMAQEETMNNCGVRTVLSGVMGAGLGVVFGIFMGTMDMAGPQPGAAGPLPPSAAPPTAATATTTATTPAGEAAAATTATGTPATPPKQSMREVLRQTAISTKQRCTSYAKGFGAMGALFAGSECVIEKARAKHDIYNAVYAGCAAGGALAASGGVKAAGVGCVSFAAFSAFIEKVMNHD